MLGFRVQQNDRELTEFIQLLQAENVRSYLEIGSKWGGSLWRISLALPSNSTIVAVDLPHGQAERMELNRCVKELRTIERKVFLIEGDSTDPKIISRVQTLGPYDACLIDANHTLPYVTKDWENYGPCARIVAFHDIAFNHHYPTRMPIDVPKLWREIRGKYRHKEIRYDPADNGFGILWTR